MPTLEVKTCSLFTSFTNGVGRGTARRIILFSPAKSWDLQSHKELVIMDNGLSQRTF
jgi:hypothetical protein